MLTQVVLTEEGAGFGGLLRTGGVIMGGEVRWAGGQLSTKCAGDTAVLGRALGGASRGF